MASPVDHVAMEQMQLLQQRLREALYAKKARMRELAELCKREQVALRAWVADRKQNALRELHDSARQARAAAKARRAQLLAEARRAATSSVELARRAVDIERAHAAEQQRISRAHQSERAHIDKAHARAVSADQTPSSATLERLRPMLEKAGAIRPAPGESRTEALWRYARAHPEQMHALLEPKAERHIEQTRQQIAAMGAALRSGQVVRTTVAKPRAGRPPRPSPAVPSRPSAAPVRAAKAAAAAAPPRAASAAQIRSLNVAPRVVRPSKRQPKKRAAKAATEAVSEPKEPRAQALAPVPAQGSVAQAAPPASEAPPPVASQAPPPVAPTAPPTAHATGSKAATAMWTPASASARGPRSPPATQTPRSRIVWQREDEAVTHPELLPGKLAARYVRDLRAKLGRGVEVVAEASKTTLPRGWSYGNFTHVRVGEHKVTFTLNVATPGLDKSRGEASGNAMVDGRVVGMGRDDTPQVVIATLVGEVADQLRPRTSPPASSPGTTSRASAGGRRAPKPPGAAEPPRRPTAISTPAPHAMLRAPEPSPRTPPAAATPHAAPPPRPAEVAVLASAPVKATPVEASQRRPSAACNATYDPGDNKLRLRSSSRLDSETFARVKAAGFSWAPKQGLFVAPAWTPAREDLLLELCGDIDDEDTTLVDRAEERAGRFEDYQSKRASDAASAHRAVEALGQRFEFGQPILVGHHSEARARRDKERIESGMRRAVRMWETSQYWQARAKGAIRSAKYKERPDVRHRRIKGLEADVRKHTKERDQDAAFLKAWRRPDLTREQAMGIANVDHIQLPPQPPEKWGRSLWSALDDSSITAADARAVAERTHERMIGWHERWLAHLGHRLAYERAMLDEAGGIAVKAKGFEVQVGGQVLERFGWAVVLRVNKVAGEVRSYTVAGKWGKRTVGIEEVRDYRPPAAGDTDKVMAAGKLGTIVNRPGDRHLPMTSEEWKKWQRATDSAGLARAEATPDHDRYRYRQLYKGGEPREVFLTDAPVVQAPALRSAPVQLPERETAEGKARPAAKTPAPTVYDAMKASLRTGVGVAVADQLFPTPPELAERMVALAHIQPGERVLEPSAGTGRLMRAALAVPGALVMAVEIRADLAQALAPKDGDASYIVRRGDFLELTPSQLGMFDVVLMNPPFADGADVKHILHARAFLKPGGRLVAICANGSRQRAALQPMAASWEELAEGTFKSSGTGVRTVLLTLRSPAAHVEASTPPPSAT